MLEKNSQDLSIDYYMDQIETYEIIKYENIRNEEKLIQVFK